MAPLRMDVPSSRTSTPFLRTTARSSSDKAVINSMPRSIAFSVICECLSWGHDAANSKLQSLVELPDFSWKTFVEMATEQLMAATMSSALQKKGLKTSFPEPVAKYFDVMRSLNLKRNEQIELEIGQFAKKLNGIGVVPVLLKGACGLISGLYSERAARIMYDIDALVPANRANECFNLLRREGYDAYWPGLAPNPHHHHLQELRRPGGVAGIELHRELLEEPDGQFIDPEEVISQARILNHQGAEVAVPSWTHQVMINIAHAQFADRCYLIGRTQLRSLYDFGLLANRHSGVDWSAVQRLFAGGLKQTAYEFHLLAARTWLSVRTPRSVVPGPLAQSLFSRSRRMIDQPKLLDRTERSLRPLLSLRRDLFSADLRARLLHNIGNQEWWRHNLGKLRRPKP
jgi:Uncharacterised nucleotidyltransferase